MNQPSFETERLPNGRHLVTLRFEVTNREAAGGCSDALVDVVTTLLSRALLCVDAECVRRKLKARTRRAAVSA